MRILHVLPSDRFSGAENVVLQIMRMFAAEPDVTMVYCSVDGPIRSVLESRGVSHELTKAFTASELRRVLQKVNPDIIHAHDMKAAVLSAFVAGSTPVVAHVHSNSSASQAFSLKSVLFLMAAVKLRHIFWVSQSSFQEYRFHKLLSRKSEILYNIIDIDELRSRAQSAENTTRYDIVYLGRLTPQKDPRRLLDVIRLVVNKRPETRAALIGEGAMRSELELLAQEYGIAPNVDFLGFLSQPYALVRSSQLMLMTSLCHTDFSVYSNRDGWLYHAIYGGEQLQVNPDYTHVSLFLPQGSKPKQDERVLLLLRIVIECHLARRGVVSLHSACVQCHGQAVAFTGNSGMGKSTRAAIWVEYLNAQWLSGDRPALSAAEERCYGVPWDGKERLYINTSYPLHAILEIRRGHAASVRRLSKLQAKRVLMQQCFLPMWDNETAWQVMQSIERLAGSGKLYRIICDRSVCAAQSIYEILFHHPEQIHEEALDLKIKEGFVLRKLMGEAMVMPTGANIAKFEGAVVLNEVSAFLFEKLQAPISEDDLLAMLLAEYEVDAATARADLTALLNQFRSFGMLEEQV